MKDDMIIWQGGREFKIDDYGEYTSVLIKHIMEHGSKSLAYHDTMFGENNVRYWITLDRKNLKLIPYRSPEYDACRRSFYTAISDEQIDAYYEQYREANVSQATIDLLEDFIYTGKLTVKEMK
jgi:hypothetical protein